MDNKKIERLILKDNDVLVVKVPNHFFHAKKAVMSLYTQIKKQMLPRKNKILMLPYDIELSVIGKEQIEEYISHIDLWSLFDEEGDEINGRSSNRET